MYECNCSNDHLYIKTTCVYRPHFTGPQGYIPPVIEPVYKDHMYKDQMLLDPKAVFVYMYKFHSMWISRYIGSPSHLYFGNMTLGDRLATTRTYC